MKLGTNDFDYRLEDERIAQQPLSQRDSSRLMTLRRSDGQLGHHVFSELPSLLAGGDREVFVRKLLGAALEAFKKQLGE